MLNGIKNKAILSLFYSTGLRLNEMTRLKLGDIDFQNSLVRVNHAKFSRDRLVPFCETTTHWLKEYLKIRMQWAKRNPTEMALWLSHRIPHDAIKSQAIAVMVKTYAKQIQLGKSVFPHLLRHSFSTHFISNGAEPIHLQRILGHKSINSSQVYVHLGASEIKQALLKHPRARTKIPL